MSDPIPLEESEELQRSLSGGQMPLLQHRMDVHAVGPDGRPARYQVQILHDEDGLPIKRDAADLPADYAESRATRVDDSMYPGEPILPRHQGHQFGWSASEMSEEGDSSDILGVPSHGSQASGMDIGEAVHAPNTLESITCFEDCLAAARQHNACPWPRESLSFAFDVEPDHLDEAVPTYLRWAEFGTSMPYNEFAQASPDIQRCRYEGLRGLAHLGCELLHRMTADRDEKSRETQKLLFELEEARKRELTMLDLLARIEGLVAEVHGPGNPRIN